MRYNNIIILILLLSIQSLGCAFGTRHVALNPVNSKMEINADGKIVHLQVNDKRQQNLKPVVGHVKNGYGMKTARVVSDKNVTTWVNKCISKELVKAGAFIVNANDESYEKINNIIVDILVCYAQAFGRYGGEVEVKISIKSNGKTIFRQQKFKGEAILGLNWAATSSSYQKVLHLAMKDLLNKIMPEITNAIKS